MDKKLDVYSSPQVQSLLDVTAKSFSNAAFPEELLAQEKMRFDDIESVAVQIGDAISRKILQHACGQRAKQIQQDAQIQCPVCEHLVEPVDPNSKILLSRRGEVTWQEPAHFCKKCRRAFFPSIPRIGN